MADFTQIIQEINADINTNGVGAITGAKLNEVLRDMIAAVNAAKQDPLTIDATPTDDSTNPVQSGGVYDALDTKADKVQLATNNDIATLGANGNLKDSGISIGNVAMDANVVHKNGDETISGEKTFADKTIFNNEIKLIDGNEIGAKFYSSEEGKIEFYGSPSSGTVQLKHITSPSVSSDAATKGYVDGEVAGKQDTISDLATIRSGAALGATSIQSSEKGAASGVATLDSGGKVPQSQLPSYVDDVLEYANLASFPATGESGKIYVALDTNKTYRWGGSAYVEISQSLALGETSSTAFPGDRGKAIEDKIPSSASSSNKLATNEDVNGVNLLVEQSSLTDQQRNTALANVSNQTANTTTGKMGYKVLDPTKTFASQVTAENTIYEIRGVFDLNNGGVTIPAGSTLKFNGGVVSNGTLTGNNTIIDGKPLFKAITFGGSYVCNHVSSKDFKYATDDDALTAVFQFLNCIKKDVVCELEAKTYNIDYESSISGNTLFSKWQLDDCSNVTINGNNAVLNHTNPLTDIPASLSQLNSILKLNSCSYITIRGITYQNLNGYDTNYKGDCDGICVIFFEGDNSFLDVSMTIKNARVALGNHIYAAGNTNHIGLVSDSNFNVKQYHTGYGVTFSWIGNSKINVESHGQHRGVYLTGASNCDVYLEWEDQWTAPIACLIGDSWTGGSDNLVWHSCKDLNITSICTEETANADDAVLKYCAGLNSIAETRNFGLTMRDVVINTYSVYGLGQGFLASIDTAPSDDNLIIDVYKNFTITSNKVSRIELHDNRVLQDWTIINSNLSYLYANFGVSSTLIVQNSYIDRAIIGKGNYEFINTDIRELSDLNSQSSKTNTNILFDNCFITSTSNLSIKATITSSMLPFRQSYFWPFSVLYSGTNCDVSRVMMPNYRSSAINYGSLLIQTTNNGITTSRPNNAENRVVGVVYFDTTLGKPIWWNGTSWVDATGTAV